METFIILPPEVEEIIKNHIDQKIREEDLESTFSKRLLREDVIALLEKFCTVVYFPLKDSINGFHINDVPLADGSKRDFVFINTAQTMEKQNFTAAHELGHFWKVDDVVLKSMQLEDSSEIREAIINRFAATLLMPKDSFRTLTEQKLTELKITNKKTTVSNALKVVAFLMNHFYAPRKAVVLRLLELSAISLESAYVLLGDRDVTNDDIDHFMRKHIRDAGYTRLGNRSERKWIEGLGELLEIAEEKGLVTQEKIAGLRATFGLKKLPVSTEMEEEFSLKAQEGNDAQ